MKCAPQTYKRKTVTGYIKTKKKKKKLKKKKLKQSQGTERKDRREDLNAAYVGAEEMCTGNEFQIKGALIKKEYR